MTSRYVKKGRLRGEFHPGAKLTVQQVIEIFQSSEKQAYLASVHGVTQGAITAIQSGKTWRHITQRLMKLDELA